MAPVNRSNIAFFTLMIAWMYRQCCLRVACVIVGFGCAPRWHQCCLRVACVIVGSFGCASCWHMLHVLICSCMRDRWVLRLCVLLAHASCAYMYVYIYIYIYSKHVGRWHLATPIERLLIYITHYIFNRPLAPRHASLSAHILLWQFAPGDAVFMIVGLHPWHVVRVAPVCTGFDHAQQCSRPIECAAQLHSWSLDACHYNTIRQVRVVRSSAPPSFIRGRSLQHVIITIGQVRGRRRWLHRRRGSRTGL